MPCCETSGKMIVIVACSRIDTHTRNSGHWVDVRDIALAPVLSLQKEELSGERVIVGSLEPYKAIEWRM